MPDTKNKKINTGQQSDSSSIPAELDRQLQAVCLEITGVASRVCEEITGVEGHGRDFSGREPAGDHLGLVQNLLFHCIGYAHHFSMVLTRPYTEKIVPRLIGLFSDCFYREFFSQQDRPGAYEYFRMVFTQDYLSFFREMEERNMLALSPDEFLSRSVDMVMECPCLKTVTAGEAHTETRNLVSEFMEKRAFLKISRVLLSF